jgi:hypothetical protein
MTSSVHRGPAKIYQFPLKARTPAGHLDDGKRAADIASPPIADTEFGSGWYHDEAIEEAERSRKN